MEYILKGYTQHEDEVETGDNSTMNYRPWVSSSSNRLHTSQLQGARRFGSPEQAMDYLKLAVVGRNGNPRYQLHDIYEVQMVIIPNTNPANGRLCFD